MFEERYRVGNKMLTKDEFIKEIFLTLRKNPYEEIESLQEIMGIRNKQELHDFLLYGIFKYIKEHKGIRFSKVWEDLKVNKKYILETIDYYEIDMDVKNIDELDQKESESSKNNINQRKLELLNNLKNELSKGSSSNNTRSNSNGIGSGFYTSDRRTGR